MKEKILITGASGFIGSFIVEAALQNGLEVFAGIRKSSSRKYLQQKEIRFLELNLQSETILKNQLETFIQENGGLDYVIHNAGITQAKKQEAFLEINYGCTKNLVNALQSAGIRLKKFVLISSLAAYGPGEEKKFTPIELRDEPHPVSAYGKSKLAAEQYLKLQENFPYIIINPTAVYGPRDKDFFQFVQLINKGFEPYIGTNKQMVSLIYVKDLAKAIVTSARSSFANRSYIVSDGRDYNKEELGKTVSSLLYKKTIKIKIPAGLIKSMLFIVEKTYRLFGSMPFLNTEKVNEISGANWLCNSSDTWQDLKTVPFYFLDTGMKETIEWYRQENWL